MDYSGNSDKSKEKAKKKPEEKKIEPVVTGTVIRKQKPIGRKFKEVFFGGDFKTAVSVVVASVVLPTLRDMVYNSVSRGTENVIYGQSYRKGPAQFGGRTQYNSPVVRTSLGRDPRESGRSIFMPDQAPRPSVSASRRDSNEIIVREREDADKVIEKMFAIVEQWNVVSVADMCELLNIPSSPIDNKYGWTSLNSVEIRQVREGFLLDLPPLEEI